MQTPKVTAGVARSMFQMVSKEMRLKDIALHFKVSAMTVSRALRGDLDVVRKNSDLNQMAAQYRERRKKRIVVTQAFEKSVRDLQHTKSVSAIARQLGVSRSAVQNILNDAHTRAAPEYVANAQNKFNKARYRSQGQVRKFELTGRDFDDVIERRECLTCGSKDTDIRQYSVDRLYPDLGYVKGNVACMCWTCNKMKGIRDILSFVRQCEAIQRFVTNDPLYSYDPDIHPKKMNGSSFSNAKWAAKRRKGGIAFKLDKASYETLQDRACCYCGRPSGENGRNGVDRIDSARGYLEGNCQTLCSNCNFSKKDVPADVFLERVRSVAARAPEALQEVQRMRRINRVTGGRAVKEAHPLQRAKNS